MIKVLYVITGLNAGGAETALSRLASGSTETIDAAVVTLRGGGAIQRQLREIGVRVYDIGLDGPASLLGAVLRFRKIIRLEKPKIIHAWLYHAILFATLCSILFRSQSAIIWGIRSSLDDRQNNSVIPWRVVGLCARLSGHAQRIIYNSEKARLQHEQHGFVQERACCIPNGFDTEKFAPDMSVRLAIREMLGVGRETLIGAIGRNDPMKDYPMLIRAAGQLRDRVSGIRFILVGRGVDEDPVLTQLICALQLDASILLLGEVEDVCSYLQAIDIFVLPSWSEGFPNVVGEAMACAKPGVATDVGGVRELVGDTWLIVPPRNPSELANGLATLSNMDEIERAQMGNAARTRVAKQFSLASNVQAFLKAYESVLT